MLLNGHNPIPSRRPFQVEACDDIMKDWKEFKRLMCIMPTGSGKSLTSGWLVAEEIKRGNRVLMLAHTRKLVKQYRNNFEDDYRIPATIEMGQEYQADDSMLVCACDKTMVNRIKKGKWKPDAFSVVLTDECHRILSPSYQEIMEHFKDARVLGISATPRRGDRRDLMKFFDKMSVDIKITRLWEEGWLSEWVFRNVPFPIKLEHSKKSGDFTEEDCAHAIEPFLENLADEVAKHAKGRCGLSFLPLIQTSKTFVKLLCERGIKAEHVDGKMPDKQQEAVQKRLERGEIDMASCSMLWVEGIDIRPINLLVPLRPTQSWTLWQQMLGRGTRLYDPAVHDPGWPKKDKCVVLDFLWLCDQLVQRPSTLIASDDDEAAEIDKKRDIAADAGEEFDLLEAVKVVRHEREETLRKRLEEMATRKAREVGAMEFFLQSGRADLVGYEPLSRWELEKVTPGQREVLINAGFDMETIPDKGTATMAIDTIIQRRVKGLCTVRQANFLSRNKIPNPWDRSFDEASSLISIIKSGGNPFHGCPD